MASMSYVTKYKVEYSTNGQSFYTIQENGVDKVLCSHLFCIPFYSFGGKPVAYSQ